MLQKRARHWGACCTTEVCSAVKTTSGAAHRAVRIAHRSANHLDQHRRGLARTPAGQLQRSELCCTRASGRSGCISSSRARPTHRPKTRIGSYLQQPNVRKTTGCIEQPHISTALGTRKQSKSQKNIARKACHGVTFLFASSVKKPLVARSREASQCHASACCTSRCLQAGTPPAGVDCISPCIQPHRPYEKSPRCTTNAGGIECRPLSATWQPRRNQHKFRCESFARRAFSSQQPIQTKRQRSAGQRPCQYLHVLPKTTEQAPRCRQNRHKLHMWHQTRAPEFDSSSCMQLLTGGRALVRCLGRRSPNLGRTAEGNCNLPSHGQLPSRTLCDAVALTCYHAATPQQQLRNDRGPRQTEP